MKRKVQGVLEYMNSAIIIPYLLQKLRRSSPNSESPLWVELHFSDPLTQKFSDRLHNENSQSPLEMDGKYNLYFQRSSATQPYAEEVLQLDVHDLSAFSQMALVAAAALKLTRSDQKTQYFFYRRRAYRGEHGVGNGYTTWATPLRRDYRQIYCSIIAKHSNPLS